MLEYERNRYLRMAEKLSDVAEFTSHLTERAAFLDLVKHQEELERAYYRLLKDYYRLLTTT